MKRPPTDFELIQAIWERYQDAFANYVEGAAARDAKILVPIDLDELARHFDVDVDSVFGRLYYHLEPKYGRETTTGARQVFFTPVAGSDKNCVNFPLLEAVLAGLWQQRRRELWAIGTACVSLAIAIVSLVVSIVTA